MKCNSLKIIVAAAVAGLLVGCMNRELVRIDPLTESYILLDVPVQNFIGVDILVVVDNSGSMAQEQNMLKAAFPSLITSILNPDIDPATGERVHAPVRDLHLGVVSVDMGVGGYNVPTCNVSALIGDDGVLQHTPRGAGCAGTYSTYIEYAILPTAEPDPTVIDQKAADFGCIAVLGTLGCGFEQQLEAAHKALIDQSVAGFPNAGFLRQDTILTILFVTDEEDCSAADNTIFANLPLEVNLQCFWNKPKLHVVERYIQDFMALRGGPGPGGEAPSNLVVGFIVGVPPSVPPGGPPCEGRGDAIGGCLSEPAMQETINSSDPQYLNNVCTFPVGCTPDVDCTTQAFPGRRFVEVAQGLGDNAVVQSICTDTFEPAVAALTEKLREAIGEQAFHRSLAVYKDPDDPTHCRCLSECYFIEELGDNRPCPVLPAEKPPWDGNGDTVPDTKIDEEGQVHTLCEIPQAGSHTTRCDLPCDSPDATYTKDPDIPGWWYNPYEPSTTGTTATVHFEGVEPAPGSGVSIQCSSVVCPSERRCGPSSALDSKCCDINEYCYYPNDNKDNPGLCLLRRDICEQYGDNEWCPYAGPVGDVSLIGGLCCVDPESDGHLNLADTDGDGLLDTPEWNCQGNACGPAL